jgi:hypothetical protein
MYLFTYSSPEEQEKVDLINKFWPRLKFQSDSFDENLYSVFFDSLATTLKTLQEYGDEFAVQDFQGIYLIIQRLSKNPKMTRNDVKKSIRRDFINTGNKKMHRSIELAVNLWLGINISSSSLHVGPVIAGDSSIEWPVNQQLQTVIDDEFDQLLHRNIHTSFTIDHSFTYEKIRKYRQVQIVWTNNLMDHLKLEGPQGQRALWVYQHRICLENHLVCVHNGSKRIIKKEVLMEAIRTLNLLFPYGDPRTAILLAKHGRENLYTPPYWKAGQAQSLSDFKYWNSHLAQLLNLYQGPPESKWQYFRDRRNFGQWASLWAAVFLVILLTVVFGVVSSYYGARSTYLAGEANRISLSMSCIEHSNVTELDCRLIN